MSVSLSDSALSAICSCLPKYMRRVLPGTLCDGLGGSFHLVILVER